MEYVNCYEDVCKTLYGSMFYLQQKEEALWKELFELQRYCISTFSLHKEEERKTNYLERKNGS